MKRLAIILGALLGLAIPASGQIHARYNFINSQQFPQGVKKVRLTPLLAFTVTGTNIVTGDWMEKTVNANGSVTFSNLIPGSYRVLFTGSFTPTTFTNSFGTNVSGLVDASDEAYLTISTNLPAGSTAYSQSAADTKFVDSAGDTMTGTVTNNAGYYGNGVGLTNVTAAAGTAPFPVSAVGGLEALHFNDYQVGPGMYGIAGNHLYILAASGMQVRLNSALIASGTTGDTTITRNLIVTDRLSGDGSTLNIPMEPGVVGRQKPATEVGKWRKPAIAFTPWWETLHTNNAAWSSNKISYLATNGFVTAVRAAGSTPIYWFDDSLAATNRIGGALVVDSNNYPAGLKVVCDFARANGFGVGLYTAFATNTCSGRAGSPRSLVQQDLNWLASFGMDALKVDNCGDAGQGSVGSDRNYQASLVNLFHNGIVNLPLENGMGGTNTRPVYFLASIVWEGTDPPSVNKRVTSQLNSWEDPSGVVAPFTFGGAAVDCTSNVVYYLGRSTNMVNNSGYGHYTGLFGFDAPDMTTNAIQAAMTACAIAPSPIIVGGITNANRQWFTNTELYSIHQDALTEPGICFSNNPAGLNIWSRPLTNSDIALALFNTGASNTFTINLNSLGISNRVSVRDVWQQSSAGYSYQTMSVSLRSNSSALFRLTQLVTDPVVIAGSDGAGFSYKRADGSTMVNLGTLPGFNSFGGIWITPASGTATANNYSMNSDGANNTTVNAPSVSGKVLFYGANSTAFGSLSRGGLLLYQNGGTPPSPSGTEVYIWNSNMVVYGVSATKTNLITDLR
jgi:alpha-galactosidase